MKSSLKLFAAAFTTLLIVLFLGANLQAQTTSFTYQGRLNDMSMPANTNYDFEFELYDALANGTQIGTTLSKPNVQVTAGIFSVTLDFGAGAFPGADRFLRISVKRSTDPNPPTPLTPRQPITSAPYSIRSKDATAADSLSAACVLCVTDAQIATGISGTKISGSVPNADNATTAGTATTATTAGNVTGTVAIANGGTGSTTKNFVDLANAQTVAGAKTFSSAVDAPQYNIGGSRVLDNPGTNNLFAGVNAGTPNTGAGNSFFGTNAGQGSTTGVQNAFFGTNTGLVNGIGDSNVFVGFDAGRNNTNSNNTFVGAFAGNVNTTGFNNTLIGSGANVSVNNLTFATAVGSGAVADASSRVVIGRNTDTVRIPGTTRVGLETGSTQLPAVNATGGYTGLITRRVNSNVVTAGQIIARTDNMTLERDGSAGGLQISYTAVATNRSLLCMGVTSTGATLNARIIIPNAAAGTSVVYTNAQSVEFIQCSFGDPYNLNHLTQVTFQRYQSDSYWVGTVTSTFNQ